MPYGYKSPGDRRPLVQRPVQRFGATPPGPMSQTLPQRVGQTPAGPLAMNVGQQHGPGPNMDSGYAAYGQGMQHQQFIGVGNLPGYQPTPGYSPPAPQNQPSMPSVVPPHIPVTGQQQSNTPQVWDDYQRVGLSPPASGTPNPSGNALGQNGYYMPGVQQPMSGNETVGQMENRAIDQGAQHNNLDSRWAMQYPQGTLQPRGGMSSPPQTASMQEDRFQVGQQFGNSQIMDVNGRKVVVGDGHSASEVPGVRPRVGLSTGGRQYTPAQIEQNRTAHIAGQNQRADMLGAGRNIRANQRTGAPLRPDLFPGAESAYAQKGSASGPLGYSPLSNAYASATVKGEDGTTSTDWGKVALHAYDDPKMRGNPQAAWNEMRKHGATSQDIAAAAASARGGAFGGGSDNAAYVKWIEGLNAVANPQPGTAGGQIGAPTALPKFNPANPINPYVGAMPSFGFDPTNPFNPFPVKKKLPPSGMAHSLEKRGGY